MDANNNFMYKPQIICDWDFDLDRYFEKPIKIFVDTVRNCQTNNRESENNVLFLFEPNEISGVAQQTILNQKHFDTIFTHNEKVLNACSNSCLHIYGTTWIEQPVPPLKKNFSVSTVVGFKMITEGHKIRKNLWTDQNKITIPRKFFISKFGGVPNTGNNIILGEDKLPMFLSQFHIAIENSRHNHYFTEKIVDCFVTKTVPIYMGCTNIDKYFNPEGILIANSVEEIITICNQLTPDTYAKMLPAIEENYERCQQYLDFKQNIADSLNNCNYKNINK